MNSQSSYTPGQCTWGVAGWDSWIPPGLGNAAQWLMNAPAKGLRTGHTPQVGAVAVLEPGAPGVQVSVDGHVANVVGVSGDNVTVRDMNWNYQPFVTSTHTLSARSIAGYIYPPGDTIVPAPGAAAGTLDAATGQITTTGWKFGPFDNNTPIIGGIGDGVQAIGGIPGDIAGATGAIASAIGTGIHNFIVTIMKGGELLIGVAFVLGGVFILVKHSKTGNDVIQAGKSAVQKGAEVAAVAA